MFIFYWKIAYYKSFTVAYIVIAFIHDFHTFYELYVILENLLSP